MLLIFYFELYETLLLQYKLAFTTSKTSREEHSTSFLSGMWRNSQSPMMHDALWHSRTWRHFDDYDIISVLVHADFVVLFRTSSFCRWKLLPLRFGSTFPPGGSKGQRPLENDTQGLIFLQKRPGSSECGEVGFSLLENLVKGWPKIKCLTVGRVNGTLCSLLPLSPVCLLHL